MGTTRIIQFLSGMQLAFGGEKPLGPAPDGANWHHEGLTRQALAAWSPEARNAVAFHADYLDSYMYNPLWWADIPNGGGPGRLKVSLSTQSQMAKLHCDDLFDFDSVDRTIRRYLSGTVCGLIWARDADLPLRERISCAHNVIGVSLHAIQDFYSHSNWIDIAWRRERTWFDLFPEDRRYDWVYTGHYEAPEQFGIKPHGTYQLECGLLRIGFVQEALEIACHAASPLSGSSMCEAFRRCRDAQPVAIPLVEGFALPEGIGYASVGINLDSRWQAPLGVRGRGADMKPPMEPAEAFRTVYELAARASRQWMDMLESTMRAMGYGDFWNQITTTGVSDAQYKTDTAPFERMDLLPYQFLTAGPYPPPPNDADQWYLRLLIKTANTPNAGTNAPIVPVIRTPDSAGPNVPFFPAIDNDVYPPLDYRIRADNAVLNAVVSHNDFERGSVAAYMVGPLPVRPDEFILRNTAPDLGDLASAVFESFKEKVETAIQSIPGVLLSIIAGHADRVAANKRILTPQELEDLHEGAELSFEIDCDGRSEGHYVVKGTVKAVGDGTPLDNGYPTRRYQVRTDALSCIKESEWDRGSSSDEPFIIGMFLAHGGTGSRAWRTKLLSDVDTGESRDMSVGEYVEVPARYGFITVPVIVYEHDDESDGERQELMEAFRDEWQESLKAPEAGMLDLIGQAVGSVWHCESVEVFAFQRGGTVKTSRNLPFQVNRRIGGGEEILIQPWFIKWAEGLVPDGVMARRRVLRPENWAPGRLSRLPRPLEDLRRLISTTFGTGNGGSDNP